MNDTEPAPARLIAWLKANDLNAAKLAPIVGVHHSQLYRIVSGEQRASPKTAAALEAVTGIPAWDFVKP